MIDDAARCAVDALGRQDAQLTASRDAFTTKAAELTAEIARLEAGGHDAPPAPHTRDPLVRDTRPGAPLWKVTDFAPGVAEQDRARLEAALEAAGILDAWLTPDGDLIAGDVVLVSGRHPVTGPSCETVLVPAVNTGDPRAAALPEAAVRAALSAIGLGRGAGTTWVTTDGRWANGVLAGSWHKDAAGYIGEGARQTARRDRIARLTAELAEAKDAIAALDGALGELGRRRERLAAEHRAAPPGCGGARGAHQGRGAAQAPPGAAGLPHRGGTGARRTPGGDWRPPGSRRTSSPPIPGCPRTRRSWPPSGRDWATTGWRWPGCGRPRRRSRPHASARPRPQRSSPRQSNASPRPPSGQRRPGRGGRRPGVL